MRSLSLVRVVAAGLVALALVAHVWMFDVVGAHGPSHAPEATTVSTVQPPLAVSGCAAAMSACEVPMPADPTLILLVAGLAAWVVFLGITQRHLRPPLASSGATMERAPPQRPPGASSVVLLV